MIQILCMICLAMALTACGEAMKFGMDTASEKDRTPAAVMEEGPNQDGTDGDLSLDQTSGNSQQPGASGGSSDKCYYGDTLNNFPARLEIKRMSAAALNGGHDVYITLLFRNNSDQPVYDSYAQLQCSFWGQAIHPFPATYPTIASFGLEIPPNTERAITIPFRYHTDKWPTTQIACAIISHRYVYAKCYDTPVY